MSTTVVTSYQSTPNLGATVFVTIYNSLTGSVLQARTHTGITERLQGTTHTGFYRWSASIADAAAYEAVWDEAGAIFAGEVIIPQATSSGGGSGTTVIAATAPATTNPLVFIMKRGDTDPSISAQALYPDPSNPASYIPWPIPDGSAVKFTMRDSADFASRTRTAFTQTTPKVHATASIDDAGNGLMSYGWVAGDTDTDGLFRAEFEVTSGSEIRTFPVGADDTRNWIAVTIVDDLDPGINP